MLLAAAWPRRREEEVTVQAIATLLADWSATLQSLLADLEQRSVLVDRQLASDALIIIGAPYGWDPLDASGAVIQRRLLDEYKRFHSVVMALVRNGPETTREECEAANREVLAAIEQNEAQWSARAEVFERARKATATQVERIQRAYETTSEEVVLVPDTNALLYNPALEEWSFADATKILVLLVPGVVGELDKLKQHRVETVREKSERLIRQIKEYRRRGGGRLDEGVSLRRDYSRLASWPIEPRVEDTLPWLDPTNADDRILAALIEVMRDRAGTPVILVTRDLNLQNKAEFAHVPFIEPPDPRTP
jgi:hypothetical protein